MKVYDKEMYSKQETLKTTVIFIAVFLLGFFAGYMTNSFTNHSVENKENNNIYIVEGKLD